jgi:ligand-binding SRPBCC domain-containing protein
VVAKGIKAGDVIDPVAPFLFRAEQFVPQPLDEVFEFFSKAENLQRLTPPWLHFRVIRVQPVPVRECTLIQYSLRWRIFPIRWTTQIVVWQPPYRFVDLQVRGPYKLWRHEHQFIAEVNGTMITDEVQYLLPLGIIGRLAHAVKVRSDVEAIFAYRTAAVRRIFEDRN